MPQLTETQSGRALHYAKRAAALMQFYPPPSLTA